MKVLVTGSDGYIGAVLAPRLIGRGHDVVGLDTGFFRSGWLYSPPTEAPRTITKDVRNVSTGDLEGFDAIVHLAELSNDPLGQLAPDVTRAINHRGSRDLARAAADAGVRRFVYASSCSVYGIAGDADVTEEAPVNPQTTYAECKTLVEQELLDLADSSFSPTILRNATVFGPSPRMRFDLVLNNLCGLAWTSGEIAMVSDGTPWRPLVHVEDVAEAMRCVLEAKRDDVHAEVFNVGHTSHNYQIGEIADIVASVFEDCRVTLGSMGADRRSYRVSFEKIARRLPSFVCTWDATMGTKELHELFGRLDLSRSDFEAPAHTRLSEIRRLIESGQVDADLRWTKR